jgi:hypothetical protein
VASQDSRRPVGKTHARDAKPRNAAEITSLALVNRWILLRAVDQGQFLLESHLAEQLVDSRVACDDGNGLRLSDGGEKKQ